jgi:hypothetical protein
MSGEAVQGVAVRWAARRFDASALSGCAACRDIKKALLDCRRVFGD